MLRKVLLWVLLGLPPLLLLHWNERHGHPLPTWVLLLSAAPLLIALLLNDDDQPGPLGNFLLFLMGLAGVGVGLVAFAAKDAAVLYGLGGPLAWAAPVGLVMMVAAVMRGRDN